MAFSVGQTVIITGLRSREDLNGSEGTVLSLDESSGRYAVQLEAESVRVKPENLLDEAATRAQSQSLTLPPELIRRVAELLEQDPAGLLALACTAQDAQRALSAPGVTLRADAKQAVAQAQDFIRLKMHSSWDKAARGSWHAAFSSLRHEEWWWEPGADSQGCDSLPQLLQCTKLALCGYKAGGNRGYRPGRSRGAVAAGGPFVLPTALCMLPRLTSLDLSHNGTMTDLPEAFAQLTSLKILIIEGNAFERLPDSLCRLPVLEVLRADMSTRMTDLSGLSRLATLHTAEVSAAKSPILPDFAKLGQLSELKLTRCFIGSPITLPDSIGKCATLIELDLKEMGLELLPDDFGLLCHLVDLNLSGNSLTHLPKTMHKLARLRYLELHAQFRRREDEPDEGASDAESSHEEAPGLALGASALPAIRMLDLSGDHYSGYAYKIVACSEQQLPATVLMHSTLEQLFITQSHLTTFPIIEPAVLSWKLAVLNLNENDLRALPDCFGLLTTLTQLGLAHNHLEPLPLPVCRLVRLKVLNLSYNGLTQLPPQFSNLTDLRALQLEHNQLTELPVGSMRKLKMLISHDNRISDFSSAETLPIEYFTDYRNPGSQDRCANGKREDAQVFWADDEHELRNDRGGTHFRNEHDVRVDVRTWHC